METIKKSGKFYFLAFKMSEPGSVVKRKADSQLTSGPKKRKWYQSRAARYGLWFGCACVVAAIGVGLMIATGGAAAGVEATILSGAVMGGESSTIVGTAAGLTTAIAAEEAGATAVAGETAALASGTIVAGVSTSTEIGTGVAAGETAGGLIAGETGTVVSESAAAASTGVSASATVAGEGVGAGEAGFINTVHMDLVSKAFWAHMLSMTAAFFIIDKASHPIDTAKDIAEGGRWTWHKSVYACRYLYRKARGIKVDPKECPEEYLQGLKEGAEISAAQLADRYCGAHQIDSLTDEDVNQINSDFLKHHFKLIKDEDDPYFIRQQTDSEPPTIPHPTPVATQPPTPSSDIPGTNPSSDDNKT